MKNLILLFITTFFSMSVLAQNKKMSKENLEANQVYLSFVKIEGKDVVKVVADTTIKGTDEATIAKLKDFDFKNGTIEVKVLSRLMKNAPAFARGFIGLAFRIGEKNEKFEGIYIRPTNGRADDQIRRNHSIQYFAFPDYRFDKLRKTDPEKYESYADMWLNEWITIRIEVENAKAKLFLNNAKHPSLVVNDLKLGAENHGGIALWVGNWTEGHFKDLRVARKY
jgi:hypothetical protein